MRIGLLMLGDAPVQVMVERARLAEAVGYDAVWAQPRHFAVKIAVRVGCGPIAPRAEPIEETKETGIIPA